MNKIDWKNLPSTDTPIDADNLNLMQDNIEEAIDEVAYGTTLYENATGTLDAITLSETIANFSKIEIQYKTSDNSINSKIIPNNKASSVKSGLIDVFSDTSGYGWLKLRTIQISGTSLTNLGTTQYAFRGNEITSSNYIYITKIIGYK